MIDEHPRRQFADLVKHFPVQGSWFARERQVVHALDGVSLDINAGEVLGLVGESGCGKTTLGRCVLRLIDLTSGQRVRSRGRTSRRSTGTALRRLRAEMQIVFQNPFSSLSPRMRIARDPARTAADASRPYARMARADPHARWNRLVWAQQHLDRYPA